MGNRKVTAASKLFGSGFTHVEYFMPYCDLQFWLYPTKNSDKCWESNLTIWPPGVIKHLVFSVILLYLQAEKKASGDGLSPPTMTVEVLDVGCTYLRLPVKNSKYS